MGSDFPGLPEDLKDLFTEKHAVGNLELGAGALGSRSPVGFGESRSSGNMPTSSPTIETRYSNDSGGGGTSETSTSSGGKKKGPAGEQRKQAPKVGLATEDKYSNNDGHNAYDEETAVRYAEKIEARAKEIAASDKSRADATNPTNADYAQAEAELREKFEDESVANAYKHADVLRAAERAGLGHETADKMKDAGALETDKVLSEYRESLDSVLGKLGLTAEQIVETKNGLEKGIIKEETLRGMSEVPPKEQRSRAEVISDAVELDAKRGSHEEADLKVLRDFEKLLDETAESRVTATGLGKILDGYIGKKGRESKEGGKALEMRTIWLARERHGIAMAEEIRVLYGKIQNGELEPREKQLLERELSTKLKKLKTNTKNLHDVHQKIATMIGHQGEMPSYPGAPKVSVEELKKAKVEGMDHSKMMSMMRESMRERRLTDDAKAFFTKSGILAQAEDAFEQIYKKNWRTSWGEKLQERFGGQGNEGPGAGYGREAQIYQAEPFDNKREFERFISGKGGFECLSRLTDAMQELLITSDRLHTAVARPYDRISPTEIVQLFDERKQGRRRILDRQRAVSTEFRGRAAVESWKLAGKEFWRQLGTDIAKILSSAEVLKEVKTPGGSPVYENFGWSGGIDKKLRIDFETSVTEIIESSESRIGAALQGARAASVGVESGLKFVEPLARAFVHGAGLEVARSLGVDNAFDLAHSEMMDPKGHSMETHSQALAETQRIWDKFLEIVRKSDVKSAEKKRKKADDKAERARRGY